MRLLCHQIPERSYAFCGETLVACSRCLGIYTGFIFSLMFLIAAYGFFTRGLHLTWTILLLVPMGIDGLTQLFRMRESSNPIRFFTGYLAGLSVAMVFYSILSINLKHKIISILPDLASFIPLAFMLAFILILEKYNNSNNVFLKKFFNFIAIITAIILLFGAVALYLLAFKNYAISYLAR